MPFKREGVPEVPVLRDQQALITFALFYTGTFSECVSSLLPTEAQKAFQKPLI
jgi:hypothetical protein